VRLARPGGAPVAEVAILAAHPTTLGKKNRLIRATGRGASALGRGRPWRAALFQGAIGDQSVALPEGGAHHAGAVREAVSQTVNALRFERLDAPVLGFAFGEVVLPAPAPGALPALLRAAARNVVYGALPDHARLATLRLGPAVLVFVPGEPVADVGEAWRAEAGAGAEIVSLAGGYVGYVETPDQIAARRGEAVARVTRIGPRRALGHAIGRRSRRCEPSLAAADGEPAEALGRGRVGAARAGNARA
jgi:hypothetical protein